MNILVPTFEGTMKYGRVRFGRVHAMDYPHCDGAETPLAGHTSGVCRGLLGARGASMVKRGGGRVYENKIVVDIPEGAEASGFVIQLNFTNPSSAQTIDWGDGTTTTTTGTSANHTFSAIGRYEITWDDSLLNVFPISIYKSPYIISANWKIPPTSIGGYAFYNCSSLASVGDLSACTSIGGYAFYNCSSLASVGDLSACTSIGNNAFYNCSSLASVGDLATVTTLGDSVFTKAALTSIETPSAAIASSTKNSTDPT